MCLNWDPTGIQFAWKRPSHRLQSSPNENKHGDGGERYSSLYDRKGRKDNGWGSMGGGCLAGEEGEGWERAQIDPPIAPRGISNLISQFQEVAQFSGIQKDWGPGTQSKSDWWGERLGPTEGRDLLRMNRILQESETKDCNADANNVPCQQLLIFISTFPAGLVWLVFRKTHNILPRHLFRKRRKACVKEVYTRSVNHCEPCSLICRVLSFHR